MDFDLQMILNNIDQELICLIDGEERLFRCGKDAIAELKKDKKYYSLIAITAKNSIIILTIKDIKAEIQAKNDQFIADYKKRFGHEPSFFE